MSTQIPPQLIDELMEMYVEWREACMALRTAYERWSNVRLAEREFAFAAYRAALDREEQASARYGARFEQGARELSCAQSVAAA